jgi:hypothetical protein
MRVSSIATGVETEAFGAVLMDQLGEVYVVYGKVVTTATFRETYTELPERRVNAERRLLARVRSVTRRVRDKLNRSAWKMIQARERRRMTQRMLRKPTD